MTPAVSCMSSTTLPARRLGALDSLEKISPSLSSAKPSAAAAPVADLGWFLAAAAAAAAAAMCLHFGLPTH